MQTTIRFKPQKMNHRTSTYCVKVVGRAEDSPTFDTVVMGLPVMFMQPSVVGEEPYAWLAEGMRSAIMREQILVVVEVIVAALAIGMASALDPMLLQTDPSRKVYTALMTDVVG